MGKEIKTRHVNKEIKALDKTAVAAQHIRQAYVHTKDKIKQEQAAEDGSPVEYAENKVSNTAGNAACEAAHQARKQGSKAIKGIRKRIES